MCEWVPENPARTFHEALQAEWWGQVFNRIELTSSSMGQGRWDQIFLPFYRKDIAEGRITEESALELLHCVWLQMQQCVEIKLNPVAAAGTEGFSKFEDICLGGQTPDGKDATNELTYLILESTRALPITTPEPCVRIHCEYARQAAALRRPKSSRTAGAFRSCSTTNGSFPSTSPTAQRARRR